jgi:hypothetical protein
MKLKPRPRAEVEAYWRERAMSEARPTRETRNAAPVLFLTDPVRVPFRGAVYQIPPIPYTVGLQAVELQTQILKCGEANDFDGFRNLLGEAVKIIRANVKPWKAGGWTRIKWALGWNPFRRATEMELAELLAGFLMRRMNPHE